MSDKPIRIVIETGLSDAFITAVRAEQPVTVIVYSLETGVATTYKDGDVQPLSVVPGEWARARPEVEYEVEEQGGKNKD